MVSYSLYYPNIAYIAVNRKRNNFLLQGPLPGLIDVDNGCGRVGHEMKSTYSDVEIGYAAKNAFILSSLPTGYVSSVDLKLAKRIYDTWQDGDMRVLAIIEGNEVYFGVAILCACIMRTSSRGRSRRH
jgi:hypothetical protein